MVSAIPRASLTPGMVPNDELPPLWRHSISPFYDAQPVTDPAEQAAILPEIHEFHLGQAIFVDASFAPQRFRRDRSWMLRHDDADHLLVQLFLSGSNRVANGDRYFVQAPDNIYAVNLSREVGAVSDAAQVLTLILPRDLVLDELPHLADAAGPVFAPHSTSARVFADHMIALRRHLDNATAKESPAILAGSLALLAALSRHNDAAARAASEASLAAICRHIDQHLADPELGVDSLCAHFRCSRATIYRLFKPFGGVREHIQRRRLSACFKAITAPGQTHRRIFDIALDYGFVSPSHFSSLFRAHFGMTPRDAREAGAIVPAMPTAMPAGGDPALQMWQWAKTLAAAGG